MYKRNVTWSDICRRLPLLLLIPLGLLWPRIFAGRSAWVERVFSGGIYPPVKNALTTLTSIFRFSAAEWALYALVLYAAALLLTRLFRWFCGKGTFRRLLSAILSMAILGGVILNLFYWTWGLNYFREPLATRMGLAVQARSADELSDYVLYLSERARALRKTLPEDASGVFTLGHDVNTVLDALPSAYAALAEKLPQFAGKVTRAKRVLASRYLCREQITGIYIGLTAEPNINVMQPDLLLPQAAAHEMAHQLGIASENEAEFSAYLACMESDDPRVVYSGLVQALIVSGNALCAADDARYRAAAETYGDAVWRDLLAYNTFWRAYDGPVAERADERNDAYLKHNAQESGVKSYGESVDLLLAYYDLTNR